MSMTKHDKKTPDESLLNTRQKLFVSEYLIDLNATQAAIRCGYSLRSAKQRGSECFTHPVIQKLIQNALEQRKQYLENEFCVPVDMEEFETIIKNFDSVEDAKHWASVVLMRELQKENEDLCFEVKRKSHNRDVRYLILEQAGFKCQACGAKPLPTNEVSLEIDHIIPFSKGGLDEASNLQVLCGDCNMSKGNRFAINHNKALEQSA